MSTIAANTYRLPVADKIARGTQIISQSSDNPNVPGNEGAVAQLAAAQAALQETNADYEEHRQLGKSLLARRERAIEEWNAAVRGLAGFTESITAGDPAKILSTGYDIRAAKAAPQPAPTVSDVRVAYDGTPGYSQITWKTEPGAKAYRLQISPDPMTDTSWTDIGVSIEASFRGNGATPGQRCWYRVAAVNRLGQGPWSPPALRPVM